MNLIAEFDRQAATLIRKGYSELTTGSASIFNSELEKLKPLVAQLPDCEVELETGKLPFVIVVKSSLISSEQAMSLVEKEGKPGITKLFPHQPTDFAPISEIEIPESGMYLLVDIDRGKSTINLPPNEALTLIQQANRSPLTIDEGIAIVTQFPEFLIKNNCFSLLGSRHVGDQRVPAIWINGQKHPNLGWCWDGNPHTWLGSASAKTRLA